MHTARFSALLALGLATGMACGGSVSPDSQGTGTDAGSDTGTPCKDGELGPANASCGDCPGGVPMVVQEICVNGVFVCPPQNKACPAPLHGPCDSMPKPPCESGSCILDPTCDGTQWVCPMAPSFCFVDSGADAGDGGDASKSDASQDGGPD